MAAKRLCQLSNGRFTEKIYVKFTDFRNRYCIGLIALMFRHSICCLYRRPSRFRLWDLVLALCIQPSNYSARCLKQFLEVSTELFNIFVALEKYIKSQNTWQAALKQSKPAIVSLEGVSTSFRE